MFCIHVAKTINMLSVVFTRCGWMQGRRFSSPTLFHSEHWRLSVATTSSTTTRTGDRKLCTGSRIVHGLCASSVVRKHVHFNLFSSNTAHWIFTVFITGVPLGPERVLKLFELFLSETHWIFTKVHSIYHWSPAGARKGVKIIWTFFVWNPLDFYQSSQYLSLESLWGQKGC